MNNVTSSPLWPLITGFAVAVAISTAWRSRQTAKRLEQMTLHLSRLRESDDLECSSESVSTLLYESEDKRTSEVLPAARWEEPLREEHQPLRFVMSGQFLTEVFRHVCGISATWSGYREVFCYASGLQIDSQTFVVDRIVPVKFSHQSAGGVRVEESSNIRALAALDDTGLLLAAHFHSHPTFGLDGNRPSETDRRFQERLERGGHIAVGGIFSRDGSLRFFAGLNRRFQVDVQGHGVEEVEHNVFRVRLGGGGLQLHTPLR